MRFGARETARSGTQRSVPSSPPRTRRWGARATTTIISLLSPWKRWECTTPFTWTSSALSCSPVSSRISRSAARTGFSPDWTLPPIPWSFPAHRLRRAPSISRTASRCRRMQRTPGATYRPAPVRAAGRRRDRSAKGVTHRRDPEERLTGRAERLVLQADMALVPAVVEGPQDGGEVQLARPGLVPSGRIGDLHVADARQQRPQRGDDVSLRALHVVDVVLQPDVRGGDLVQQADHLCAAGEKELRQVEGVDRLDHQPPPPRPQHPRRRAHVVHETGPLLLIRNRLVPQAGQAVQQPAVEPAGGVDGPAHALPKLLAPRRMGGDAAIALRPVAQRHVEEHLPQPQPPQFRRGGGGGGFGGGEIG